MSDFNALHWIGLIALVVFAVVVLDRLVRLMVNRYTKKQEEYPHRVANELPRVLHKGDKDEVIELTDDRSSETK